MTINVNEEYHRVIVEENVVRVIAVAVQGPPGPQGEQGPQGESGEGGTSLPDATEGSLLVRSDVEWEPLAAGVDGEALTIASGVPVWGEVAGDGDGAAAEAIEPVIMRSVAATETLVLPGWALSSWGTFSQAVDRLNLCPISITRQRTFNSLYLHVSSAIADSFTRVGLYAAAANGQPDTLIHDFGTIPTASTGHKNLAVEPFTLQPGYYFIAFVSSHATTLSRMVNPFRVPFELAVTGQGNFGTIALTITGVGTGPLPASLSGSTFGGFPISASNTLAYVFLNEVL